MKTTFLKFALLILLLSNCFINSKIGGKDFIQEDEKCSKENEKCEEPTDCCKGSLVCIGHLCLHRCFLDNNC